MYSMRWISISLFVVFSFVSACASAPPSLSPAGVAAFHGTQAIHSLDLLRDTAISANAQQPPLISTATTRKVVLYHRSAITTIHAAPAGWQTVVLTGLDETVKDLPAKEQQVVAPYVALIKTLLAEVK